mgnify:CR=1 FL=1
MTIADDKAVIKSADEHLQKLAMSVRAHEIAGLKSTIQCSPSAFIALTSAARRGLVPPKNRTAEMIFMFWAGMAWMAFIHWVLK